MTTKEIKNLIAKLPIPKPTSQDWNGLECLDIRGKLRTIEPALRQFIEDDMSEGSLRDVLIGVCEIATSSAVSIYELEQQRNAATLGYRLTIAEIRDSEKKRGDLFRRVQDLENENRTLRESIEEMMNE